MTHNRLGHRFQRRIDVPNWLEPKTPPSTYADKVLGTEGANLLAYWPLNEISGTVAQCLVNAAQNGTYARDVSVMTTGDGIGDGNTAPLFDGVNDVVEIGTVTFRNAFDGDVGTSMTWGQVNSAANWTDGANRHLQTIWTDPSNRMHYRKNSAANEAFWLYRAGGNPGTTVLDATFAGLVDWIPYVLTWDQSAGVNGEWKAYAGGTQRGVTRTGLTTAWVGLPAAANTCIGAQLNTPNEPWHGYLAHSAVWDVALTAAQVLELATV